MNTHPDANTNPDIVSVEAFLQAIEKEHENAARAMHHLRAAPAGLEERRGLIRYRFQAAINNCFQYFDRNVRSPSYLLCVPWLLANHQFFGRNTVLRVIISDEASPERQNIAEEFERNLVNKNLQHTSAPSIQDLASMIAAIDDTPKHTLGECYWLFELCQWLKCTHAPFSEHLKAAVASANVTEIDFTKELDLSDPKHQLLNGSANDQYHMLVVLLGALH
ncbi:hypothetical protein [Ralstonia phage RP31]|uniref:Uncharacterized protein n=1 Tax=Ralstonia phage RP31 TaxID=1923890 RepID=A0A1L7N1M4_9CAUD|nr:hypothetical protein [Ralstonia phage RP31]